MKKTINVMMDFDAGREEYSAFVMYSLLKYLNDDYDVHFYFSTDGDFEFKYIPKVFEVFTDKVKDCTRVNFQEWRNTTSIKLLPYSVKANKNIPENVYSRLYVHDIFPTLDRMLHLDDDLVVTKSLSDLWEYHPNSHIIGTNVLDWSSTAQRIGRPRFNGGCYILDVDWYRKNNILERVRRVKRSQGINPEDVLLSVTVPSEIDFLPNILFNFKAGCLSYSFPNTRPSDAYVIHWCGTNSAKPWAEPSKNKFSPQTPAPCADYWKRNYEEYQKEVSKIDN